MTKPPGSKPRQAGSAAAGYSPATSADVAEFERP